MFQTYLDGLVFMNKKNRYLVLSGLLLTIANMHAMVQSERSHLINNNDDTPNCYNSCLECCAKIVCFPCFTIQAYEHERDIRKADHKINIAKKQKELTEINQTSPASSVNITDETIEDDPYARTSFCGFDCGSIDPLIALMDRKIAYNSRAMKLGFKEDVTALHGKIQASEYMIGSRYQEGDNYHPWTIDEKLYVLINNDNNNDK